jgi:hypothetical protein
MDSFPDDGGAPRELVLRASAAASISGDDGVPRKVGLRASAAASISCDGERRGN